MKILSMILIGLFLTGCYSKYLVLQAEGVSMTKQDAGPVKNLRIGDEVEEKWCMGDTPIVEQKDDVYGLADQAIYKVQNKASKPDFITGVRIFRDSEGCAIVNGRLAWLK